MGLCIWQEDRLVCSLHVVVDEEKPLCCAGFSVTGTAKEGSLMSTGAMQEGQALVLTKPLGTGTIMAASMRRKAKGRWVMGTTFASYCILPQAILPTAFCP